VRSLSTPGWPAITWPTDARAIAFVPAGGRGRRLGNTIPLGGVSLGCFAPGLWAKRAPCDDLVEGQFRA
jgi:hypothetical protein